MRKLVLKLALKMTKSLIWWWSGLHRIERCLNENRDASGLDFLERVAKEFGVRSSLHSSLPITDKLGTTTSRMPMASVFPEVGTGSSEATASRVAVAASGCDTVISAVSRTVFFCTHHTGALDLLTTYPVLVKIAPCLKVVSNFDLLQLKPMAEISIGVHARSTGLKNQQSRCEMAEHLESGGNILIYPAGRVGYNLPWNGLGFVEILQKQASAAVPVLVDAQNGWLFSIFRGLFPKLNLVFILSPLRWRRRKIIDVYIGSRIPVSAFEGLTARQTLDEIRKQTYSLKEGESYGVRS